MRKKWELLATVSILLLVVSWIFQAELHLQGVRKTIIYVQQLSREDSTFTSSQDLPRVITKSKVIKLVFPAELDFLDLARGFFSFHLSVARANEANLDAVQCQFVSSEGVDKLVDFFNNQGCSTEVTTVEGLAADVLWRNQSDRESSEPEIVLLNAQETITEQDAKLVSAFVREKGAQDEENPLNHGFHGEQRGKVVILVESFLSNVFFDEALFFQQRGYEVHRVQLADSDEMERGRQGAGSVAQKFELILEAQIILDGLVGSHSDWRRWALPFILPPATLYVEIVPHSWGGSARPSLRAAAAAAGRPWWLLHAHAVPTARGDGGAAAAPPPMVVRTAAAAAVLDAARSVARSLSANVNGTVDDGHENSKDFLQQRFLTFLPWEQLNNQIIGLKCACATAVTLGRRLVLPLLGYQRQGIKASGHFVVEEFKWYPITRYFEESSLLSLPCNPITMEAFRYSLELLRAAGGPGPGPGGAAGGGGAAAAAAAALLAGRANPLTAAEGGAAGRAQLAAYYRGAAGLPGPADSNVQEEKRAYQLKVEEVQWRYKKSQQHTIAFGSMFWFMRFGEKMMYPLDHYYDFLDNAMYAEISKKLRFHEAFSDLVEEEVSRVLGSSFIAMHLRRGDYEGKCAGLPVTLMRKCWPDEKGIVQALQRTGADLSRTPLFVATNAAGQAEHFQFLYRLVPKIVFGKDLFRAIFGEEGHLNSTHSNGSSKLTNTGSVFLNFVKLSPSNQSDEEEESFSIEKSILDIIVCGKSNFFIGNYFSSFTRTIVERRQIISNQTSLFYD